MDEPLTSRNVQPASTPVAGQASRVTAWLAADAGPALTRLIGAWLREPRGGASKAPACVWDVAVLRAEILATWPPGAARAPAPSCEPGPGKARPAASDAGRQPAALVCPGGGRQCR
jgi:hypothetical protein